MDNEILISPRELESRLDASDWAIIDCRFDLARPEAGCEQYLAGHIPGAVYMDLDRDLASPVGPATGRHPLPDVNEFAARAGSLGLGKAKTVVVYDAGNSAVAARAWWLLRWIGHDRVKVLDGGFAAWLEHALPVNDMVPQPTAERVDATPSWDRVITTDELAAAPGSAADARLVDARDAARFRGEVEPIDPVAGHIPGAVNLPFTDCLDAAGRWREPEALLSLLAERLGPDREQEWSVMCGSGVTACHLAISALLAGYREPRLYVGSWSEWIRDPARPIGRC